MSLIVKEMMLKENTYSLDRTCILNNCLYKTCYKAESQDDDYNDDYP